MSPRPTQSPAWRSRRWMSQPVAADAPVADSVSARVAAAAPAEDTRLSLVRDPLRIAMFVLTILTVSRVHQHYPLLAKLRPALLMVLAAGAYSYLNPRYLTRENILRFWPMRRVALLGILACLSAVFGISLGGSATFILQTYSKTLLYVFLLVLSVRGVRDLYTIVWAYAISCGILSYFSLFVFGLSKQYDSYVMRLSDLYTYDSNDIGAVVIVGLACTLWLLHVTRGARRIFLLANAIGIAATIARSGSRGSFLGFAAFGLAALIAVNSVSVVRRLMSLAVIIGALMLWAPPGYWDQMHTLLQPKDDYNYSSVDGRRALIQRGVGYMLGRPVFGLGIENFMKAECTISVKARNRDPSRGIRCTPPHNSWVQAGAEMGVPGLLVWSSIIIGGIVAMLRLRGRLPRAWRRGNETERFLYGGTHYLAVALVGFGVSAFFVSFAWMDVVYIVAAMMTGLYIALRGYQGKGTELGAPTARAPGWRVTQSRVPVTASTAR